MCGACEIGCCAYCIKGNCDCFLNPSDSITKQIHDKIPKK